MEFLNWKKQVLEIAVRAYREQLVAGTSGNVSAYDRALGLMAITPSGMDYNTMAPQDIVVMKLDGAVADANPNAPSSEWRMHAKLYQELPQVSAVVHTHSPYATSFAVNGRGIPVILIEMVPFLGGDVKVCPFELPGTSELGVCAVAPLRERNACLMKNHGVLAVGNDLQQAYIRAVYVEDAAKIYHMACCTGEPVVIEECFIERMLGRA